MKLQLLALGGLAALFLSASSAQPAASASPMVSAPVHCQVPCGIYADKMRIDMWMEDVATIKKAMTQIQSLEGSEAQDRNQMVRWIMTKEQHASQIQENVASYWMAQRIKAPKVTADADAMAKYHKQLATLHAITVSAMKCKQTVEGDHAASIRTLAQEFSKTYFDGEDLEHLSGHHWK
jgi:nickel superoxide dismutase